jgi:predicted transcriptional regulator
MSVIPPRYVAPRETVTLRLDTAVHERLQEYAAFIKSPKEYIVSQLLTRLFKSDKKFKAWLREHLTPAAEAKGTDSTNRRGRA